ncbi:MAG: TlpA disulfide reductase family protein [Acidobacteriaceae bacterium]|jgi:thiol-disulfide isomerase/thioredoxin
MKRSTIVVLILVLGVAAMVWSGVMAYRMRKAMNTPPAAQAASPALRKFLDEPSANSEDSAATTAAPDENSPAALGLPDFREKPAPSFTLKSVDGKPVSLKDYKGKAVLLNFWATWCGPCKLEMPWLIELQKKYASQGFTVLGVSEDDGSTEAEARKEVSDYMAKMGVDYPVLMYDDQMNKAYGGIDYLPTSYYIGRDGKVVIEAGGLISESEMEENIKKILATGA